MSLSKLTKYCACHAQWLSWSILFTHETLFTMRGLTRVIVQTHQILRLPRKMNRMIDPCHTWNAIYNARSRGVTSVIVQTHQILRLPQKMNLMIDPCHTWNAIYNARSNKCHCPNSPNTAPATKNESHDWSLSHMKRYLQCAEQHVSLPKLTEYCACHAKWLSKISGKFLENGWNVISNAGPIRAWSDHDPSMKPSVRNPPRNRGYFSSSPRAFSIEKYNISRPGLHSKTHQVLHLPRKVTLELHQVLHLPRKMTLSWLILVTYETLFTMRGTTDGILQHHRILRLPRKMTVMTDPRHIWNVIYNARNNRWHPPTSPNSAPATQNDSPKFRANFSKTAETSFPMRDRSEHDPTMIRAWNRQSATRLATEVTFRGHHEHFVLKNTTFRAPAIIPNFTEYCACHEKWQFNITKYCACHEKWHLNVTK